MIKPEILNEIKIAYITKGYSAMQLARIYELSQPSISKYIREGDWKKDRLQYIADTEIKLKQELSLQQAREDAYNRHERAKEFKKIIKQNVNKLLDDKLKPKSHETLLTSTVTASQHVELLEGNATNREDINITDERRKEIDLLVDRYSRINNAVKN